MYHASPLLILLLVATPLAFGAAAAVGLTDRWLEQTTKHNTFSLQTHWRAGDVNDAIAAWRGHPKALHRVRIAFGWDGLLIAGYAASLSSLILLGAARSPTLISEIGRPLAALPLLAAAADLLEDVCQLRMIAIGAQDRSAFVTHLATLAKWLFFGSSLLAAAAAAATLTGLW